MLRKLTITNFKQHRLQISKCRDIFIRFRRFSFSDGDQIARENNLTIKRLDKPRNVHEASGAKLDIIGSCDMYIKLKVLGKTKHLRCLILRGRNVDREVLISCKMLKRWDLIHPTFPHETVGSYVKQGCSDL